jgi:arginyl-tRNA synthetase
MSLVDHVRSAVQEALERAARAGALGAGIDVDAIPGATFSVERPKRSEHGDLATNVALVLSKKIGKPPREIALALVRALEGSAVVRSADVAGPGFVNLRIHPSAVHAELEQILLAGQAYGRAPAATGERIDIEFVSANPTGPLHVGHARGAIFGDAVARLLEATGHRVVREYYINDHGNQVRLFADSVFAASTGQSTPEGGYAGAYIAELARWLEKVDPATLQGDRDALARACVTWTLRGIPGSHALRGIQQTLRDLDVSFDVWFSEESLHRWGHVAVALRQLEESGHLAEKDGALFFVAKEHGGSALTPESESDLHWTEDKERVVRKSDGSYTYFASDIAYFSDKISRGYDRLLTFLGADHHGYVARIRNALEALGLPGERFEALLYQLVFVYRDGKLVKFSKRAGNVIAAEEILEEIDDAVGRTGAGRDALRFFFLSRTANTNVEFDIDLAKKRTLDNPVFYVQYGHARLSSILRKAREIGFFPPERLAGHAWAPLTHPDELAIAARLSEFPAVVAAAAAGREPHKIVFYVQDLAEAFQSYFTRLKEDPILPKASQRGEPGWEATWDHGKTAARLAWVEAIRRVYGAALGLLGISAPERMDRPKDDDGEDEETRSST